MADNSLSDESAVESAISSAASYAQDIITGTHAASNVHLNSQNTHRTNAAVISISNAARSANRVIVGLKHVGPKRKSIAESSVNRTVQRTKLLIRNAIDNSTINKMLTDYRGSLSKITGSIQLDDLSNLSMARISQSNLSSEKKHMAVNDINNAVNQAQANIQSAINQQAVHDAYLGGYNAIKGSLTQYVSSNKANILDLVAHVVSQIRDEISTNQSMSLSAKSLANQQINRLQKNFKRQLDSADSITSVNRVKQQGIRAIMNVLHDNSEQLNEITNFDEFVRQTKDAVSRLNTLALGIKDKTSEYINEVRNSFETMINHSITGNVSTVIDQCEQKIARAVVRRTVEDAQNQIHSYYSYMNPDQKADTDQKISRYARKIDQTIDTDSGSSIEIDLSKGIRRIKSIVADDNRAAYQNQVKNVINLAKRQIDQMLNLPIADRNHAKRKINSFYRTNINNLGKGRNHAGVSQTRLQEQEMENHLHTLINQSLLKDAKTAIDSAATRAQGQINNSNLTPPQKQATLSRISADAKVVKAQISSDQNNNSNVNFDQSTGIGKITHDVEKSLIDDKNNDFSMVNHSIESVRGLINQFSNLDAIVEHQLSIDLDRIYRESNHRINAASTIPMADRAEQMCENRIYRAVGKIIGNLNSDKAKALQKVSDRAKQVRNQIVVSNLTFNQKQVSSNFVDRDANQAVRLIVSGQNNAEINMGLRRLVGKIKMSMDRALQLDRKNNLERANQVAQTAYNRISQVSKLSHAKVQQAYRKIESIQLNTDRNINSSGSVVLADQAEQDGENRINDIVNSIVGGTDRFKHQAHLRVKQMALPLAKKLAADQSLTTVERGQVTNQIKRIMNDTNQRINADEDRDVDDDIDRGRYSIYKVIKRANVQKINNVADRALSGIKRMNALHADSKQRAVKAVTYIRDQTTMNINQANDFNIITKIEAGGQSNVRRIIAQIANMDPVKQTAHNIINSISNHIRSQIKNDSDLAKKAKQKILPKITEITKSTNYRIDQENDEEIDRIVSNSRAALSKIETRAVQNANINRINQITQNAKQQVEKMKNLTPREDRQAHLKIDRYYHEALHNINNSKNATECAQNEQKSEGRINNVFDQTVGNNSFKQAAHDAINHKVTGAVNRIKQMKNVDDNSKKAAIKRLKSIRQRVDHDVDHVAGIQSIYSSENHGTILVKGVVDKINTKNVVNSAVESVRDRINASNLTPKQKKMARERIDRMANHSSRRSTPHTSRPQPAHKPASSVGRQQPNQIPQSQFVSEQTGVSIRTGKAAGYFDGTSGRARRLNIHESKMYLKAYERAYKVGRRKYLRAYHDGANDGKARGMIAKPMINLRGLSTGYVNGYREAYRRYKITVPFRVYAKRTIYLHSSAYFNVNNRIRKFNKHHFKHSFKVIGVIRRDDGQICYRVKGGYITADKSAVTNAYEYSLPRKVKVIDPNGIYSHKDKHFDAGNRMQFIKRGTRLKVADVVRDGNAARFMLKNGMFITSNKTRVKKSLF